MIDELKYYAEIDADLDPLHVHPSNQLLAYAAWAAGWCLYDLSDAPDFEFLFAKHRRRLENFHSRSLEARGSVDYRYTMPSVILTQDG